MPRRMKKKAWPARPTQASKTTCPDLTRCMHASTVCHATLCRIGDCCLVEALAATEQASKHVAVCLEQHWPARSSAALPCSTCALLAHCQPPTAPTTPACHAMSPPCVCVHVMYACGRVCTGLLLCMPRCACHDVSASCLGGACVSMPSVCVFVLVDANWIQSLPCMPWWCV
jgi:hypothetical protein